MAVGGVAGMDIGGRLVWSIAQPATAPSPWQVKTVSVSSANRTGFQVSDVLGMNLFGRYQQNAPIVKKEPVKQDAPVTRLNLTLVGGRCEF